MPSSLPVAADLAWWGSAWLRGDAVTDLVLDALEADGTGLLDLLTQLRRSGATSLGLALPTDGDPLGLGGPVEFNRQALMQGEAVVAVPASGLTGIGAVPHRAGHRVEWAVFEAARRSVPDVGEADRGLRAEVLRAGHDLAALDVARWRPEVADALMNLRHLPELDPPPGTPPRCVAVAARAVQARAIVDLAWGEPTADDEHKGWPLTAADERARAEALVGLDRAARRALVAACSPEVWPE